MKRFVVVQILLTLLLAAVAPSAGRMPDTMPGECHDRGLWAALKAHNGEPVAAEQLRECIVAKGHGIEASVAVAGRHASGNWPQIMVAALIMAGEVEPQALFPFLLDQGLNGFETGSDVYLHWNVGAVILLRDWAERAGRGRLEEACSRWLAAQWSFAALQTVPRCPPAMRFNKAGRWSDPQSRRNEYGYSGPCVNAVGDRSAKPESAASPHGFLAINPMTPLLAWAVDTRRSGSYRLHVSDRSWRLDFALAAVARASGARTFLDRVPARVFGLTEEERVSLRKLTKNPVSGASRRKHLPAALRMLEGFSLLQRTRSEPERKITITRFEDGSFLALLSKSSNGATFGAKNLALGSKDLSTAIYPALHARKGAPFGSSQSFCEERSSGVVCRTPEDGIEFSVPIPRGKVAWQVVIDSRGARMAGEAQTPAPPPMVADAAPLPAPKPVAPEPPPPPPALQPALVDSTAPAAVTGFTPQVEGEYLVIRPVPDLEIRYRIGAIFEQLDLPEDLQALLSFYLSRKLRR